MKKSNFFLYSAIIPVLVGLVLFYLMNADLIGGKMELRGKDFLEDIDIYMVEHGIKVIEAKTYNGAFYGLGFVHARDRLWQLHFFRMLSQGRVSEVRKSRFLNIYI